jgi:hypothetical protein
MVVGLGIVTSHSDEREHTNASASHTLVDQTVGYVRASVPGSHIEAPSPQRILRPLLTIDLKERFPRLAPVQAPPRPILEDSQIISYYGNPYTPDMGILGADTLENVATQLEELAERYDALNGPTGVVPALHVVYAVAQRYPTDDGLYLQYVDDADVERLLELTEERGLLLFLDLQIGRSSVMAELEKVLPYLRYPQVHLAIDPEFAMTSSEVPGVHLGSLRAADINAAQAALQELVETEGLPPKLLIVHQFVDSMMPDGDAIQRYTNVELIIDMDGFGPAEIKRVKYERYAARPYASRAAIKLFFDYDPDLMSEEDVLSLEPRPAVIIYQ